MDANFLQYNDLVQFVSLFLCFQNQNRMSSTSESFFLTVIQLFMSSVIYAIFSLSYNILNIINSIIRIVLTNPTNKPKALFGRILWKRKVQELELCSVRDFLCIFSSYVDQDYVLKPTVSLYALTKNEATFVETPPGIDIYSSDVSSFVNAAQFDHSVNVIKMPISGFHTLAEKIGNPSMSTVWLSQTGRCGSTLLGQILEKVPGTLVISEPDAPAHIDCMWQEKTISESEMNQLVISVVRILYKPYPGASKICIKTRGTCISMMRPISKLFPDINQIFMYRNCKETVSSFLALLSSVPFTRFGRVCLDSEWLTVVKPYFKQKTEVHFIRTLTESKDATIAKVFNSVTMFTYMWANYMLIARDAIEHDNNILPVKYEDLIKEKVDTCTKIFQTLGIDIDNIDAALAAFDKDSQQKSLLSRARIGHTTSRLLSERDRIDADVILSMYDMPLMGHDFRI